MVYAGETERLKAWHGAHGQHGAYGPHGALMAHIAFGTFVHMVHMMQMVLGVPVVAYGAYGAHSAHCATGPQVCHTSRSGLQNSLSCLPLADWGSGACSTESRLSTSLL